jgi:hypothetical protein
MRSAAEALGSIIGTWNSSGRYGCPKVYIYLGRLAPVYSFLTNMLSRTVFYNGRIFTSEDGDATLHNTLIVEGDKVGFVGDRAGAERYIDQVCVGQSGGPD